MPDMLDPSIGVELRPNYYGKNCPGNGEHPGIDRLCEECDFFKNCFPDHDDPDHRYTYGDKRDFWRPVVREASCLDCKYRGRETSRYPTKRKAICIKTKRNGRDLRAVRCIHFEKKEDPKEQG